MLTIPVRRVALACVVVGAAVAAGGCGVRPGPVAEPVVVAAPAPDTAVAAPLSVPLPVPLSTPTPTPPPSDPPAAVDAPTQSGVPPQLDPAPMQNAAAAAEPNTTLGAVVYDRVSGAPLLSVNPDHQFRSASLVKLLIAIDVLNRGATDNERNRVARMLSVSDDGIASSFWVAGGRPDIVTRSVALLGLTGTAPPESPGRWGEVKLTANDMVRVYQYVMTMPAADHTLIVDAMAQAPEIAADGYDQHFGIPDGMNTQWAIKQGWGNNSVAKVFHSTGLVGTDWRYVVVLLTEHPLGVSTAASLQSVTAAASTLNGILPGA